MTPRMILAAGLAVVMCAMSAVTASAAYPERQIRMIVPFPPGGGTDTIARLIAQALTEKFGQTVVVENRLGAGGAIGAAAAAKSPADGYTLLVGTPGSMAINPAVQPNLPYDVLRDFQPITLVTRSPMVLTVTKDLPVKSVKELIELARAKPGSISFGSSGNWSTSFLGGELFKSLTKLDIVNVPYKGTIPAATDLVAGNIHMLIENLPVLLPYVQSGQIRLLATGGTERSPAVPDIPTISEAGVPGYESTTWTGIFVPAGTPSEIVALLRKEIIAAIDQPAIQKQFQVNGWENATAATPDEVRDYLKTKIGEIRDLAESANLKP